MAPNTVLSAGPGASLLLGMVLLVLLAVLLIVILVGYVVTGWSLMQVARDKGYPTWWAWVPGFSVYLSFKVVNGNLWVLLTLVYIVVDIIDLFVELPLLFTTISLVLNLIYLVYSLILGYRLGKEYGASKALFWIGIFFFPCYFAYYIQIGKRAKARLNGGDLIRPIRSNNGNRNSRRRSNYSPSILRPDNNPYNDDSYHNYDYSHDSHDSCDSHDSYDSGDCGSSNDD